MKKQIQKVSIKAIIYQNGKILLLKDRLGKWELPGGRLEFGENPQQALKRELQEELNIKANLKECDLVDVWSFVSTLSQKADYHYLIVIYACHFDISKISISQEHTAYKWFVPKEIENLPILSNYINSIKTFLKQDPLDEKQSKC